MIKNRFKKEKFIHCFIMISRWVS